MDETDRTEVARELEYPLQRYPVVEAYLRAFLSVFAALVLALFAVVTTVANPAGPTPGFLVGALSVVALAYAALMIRDTKVNVTRG